MAAVRASHRGVFDDGDRSIRLTLDLVAERTRHEQIGHGHIPAGRRLRRRRVDRAPQGKPGAGCGEDRGDRGGTEEHVATREGRAGWGLCDHGL